ncbi:MAG: hypothetical protein QHH75_08365 [Bacillota bacterium]|jgi:hypothetical protein|nr:hypothetical protein [Bacillota bacterium]
MAQELPGVSAGPGPEPEEATARRRRNLIIGGAAAGLVLAVILTLYFTLWRRPAEQPVAGTPATPQVSAATKEKYTVLPDTERQKETTAERLLDPFAGPMALRGIIRGGAGGDLAIIELRDTAYVAGPGATIAGTWKLKTIGRDYAVLTCGDQELRLELGGRATSGRSAAGS